MMRKTLSMLTCLGALVAARAASADVPPDTTDPTPVTSDPNQPAPTPAPTPAPQQPAPTVTTTTTTQSDTGATTTTTDEPGMYSYAWREPRLITGVGVDVMLGGGVTGFTDKLMRDTTSDVGGLWDLHVGIGTHIPVGLELGYIGTAEKMNTFDGARNGTLVGSTFEGDVRFNILPHFAWNPYVFGGLGWGHFDVTNMKFATADTGIRHSDDVLVVPMGLGIGYRDRSGLTVDVRGTFRATTSSNLVIDQASNDTARLHSWEASGAIGYEF